LRRFTIIATIFTLAIALTVAGCTEQDDSVATTTPSDDQAQVDDDAPEETPVPTPDDDSSDDSAADDAGTVDEPDPVDDVDSGQASEATGVFGFDMFAGLTDISPDENVIISPYSASILLTMLLAGADGETREAIGDVLHYDDPFDSEILAQHQALVQELTAADEDVELAIANSLWANEGTPFEDTYLNEMQDYLGAMVEEIDLGSEDAVDQIDEWVADNTNDRIEEMAEALGVPDPNLVLILLNAVYFLADWTEPFDPNLTVEGAFVTATGDEVTVPFMSRDDQHLHIQEDRFQMVRLPYGDSERFAMDVILPEEDSDLPELREEFSLDSWQNAADQLSESRVSVAMPSFELEYETEDALDQVLQDLGMGIAYSGEADFTPMSEVAPFLSTVVQKTYIRVDEEGTEAAAVTGGAMVESAPPQFRADRPFMIIISDTETNTILFLGQITDPSE
jgi:serine protease inhibitor